MKLKYIKAFAAVLVAVMLVSVGAVTTVAAAPELLIEVSAVTGEIAEEGKVTVNIYISPLSGTITVPTFNFGLDYDRSALTLTSFSTDLSDGALAYKPTGRFAFCYNEAAGIDPIVVSGKLLAAKAVFTAPDLIETTELTIGITSDANYTKYNDPDDPIYVGYSPAVISDTVTVINDDKYYRIGDMNDDSLVNNVDHAIFLRHLADWSGYRDMNAAMMDINGDGSVDAADAVHLGRCIAAWNGYTLPDGYYIIHGALS